MQIKPNRYNQTLKQSNIPLAQKSNYSYRVLQFSQKTKNHLSFDKWFYNKMLLYIRK